MIKTKELMLGNWVYAGAKTQFLMYVTGIFDDVAYLDFEGNEGDCFEYKEEEMLPVPLTEEVFKKNGFKYLCGVYYLEEDTETEFRKAHDGHFYLSYDLLDYVFTDKPVKYVHQLQNILTLVGIDIDLKI